MKICTVCNIAKPTSEFYVNKSTPTGYRYECKACSKEKNKSSYQKNKGNHCESKSKWQRENKDKVSAYGKKYYYNNIEKEQKRKKKYFIKNKEHILYCSSLWKEENKSKVRALNSKYRATKIKATPKWANLEIIESFYYFARFLELTTFGQEYHVDHVIPLQSRKVCGLHTETNLQVLRKEHNLSKSNKFDDRR